jgi:protein involved in polysaccharide export with SLBB domain
MFGLPRWTGRRPVWPAMIALLLLALAGLAGCGTMQQLTSDPPPASAGVPPPRVPQGIPQLPIPGAQPAPSYRAAPTPRGRIAMPASTGQYRLGVGDTVHISVHDEPDLTMDFTVSESGTVTYPFLGELRVRGQSVEQLQARIENGLRGDYLVNPDVRVIVTRYRVFYINGEVRNPGGYPYVPGLTVRQAAALAGGFSERASMNKISVYRESTPTVPEPAAVDTPVNPGDTVMVQQGLF